MKQTEIIHSPLDLSEELIQPLYLEGTIDRIAVSVTKPGKTSWAVTIYEEDVLTGRPKTTTPFLEVGMMNMDNVGVQAIEVDKDIPKAGIYWIGFKSDDVEESPIVKCVDGLGRHRTALKTNNDSSTEWVSTAPVVNVRYA